MEIKPGIWHGLLKSTWGAHRHPWLATASLLAERERRTPRRLVGRHPSGLALCGALPSTCGHLIRLSISLVEYSGGRFYALLSWNRW
jgi:hypothetical protein